jgi:lipopolysaccharide biosynthesis glycosyltransferase
LLVPQRAGLKIVLRKINSSAVPFPFDPFCRNRYQWVVVKGELGAAPKRFPVGGNMGVQAADHNSRADACATADQLFERGDYDGAALAYQQMADIDAGWCNLQLGRIAAHRQQWNAAIGKFDLALAADNALAIARFEKAKALESAGHDPAIAAAEFARFAREAPEDLSKAQLSALLQSANRAFKAGLFENSDALYDLLVRRGHGGYFCKLRRAEVQLSVKNPEAAIRIVDEISSDKDHDFRGDVVKARALLMLGRNGAAAKLLKTVVLKCPDNINFVRLLFNALERSKDSAQQLRSAEEYLRGLTREQKFEFLLRAKLACEDYNGLAQLYAEYPQSVSYAHASVVTQAMNALIQKNDYASVAIIFERLGGAKAPPQAIAAQLSALFAQRNWPAAETLLENIATLLEHPDQQELKLRKFEYLCFTMQFEKARAFLASWPEYRDLAGTGIARVVGLFAALGDWGTVIELFHERVSRGHPFGTNATYALLAQAARKTGRYADVLQRIAQLPGPNDALVELREALTEEMLELQALGLNKTAQDESTIPVLKNPLRVARLSIMAKALQPAQAARAKTDIYFCTDLNYLIGTVVAVFSLLRSNAALAESFSLKIFVSDDAAELAGQIFGRLADAFAISIELLRAKEILEDPSRLRAQYGFFTPGYQLSEAAYYRIFVAKWLYENGHRNRALYLDSDLCVGPGLEAFFDFDLKGMPLGARIDVQREDTSQAARRLGVAPETYFNSGVLLFDLAHPQFASALERTIDAAVNRQDILSFQDQCALNYGFHKLCASLPEELNFFVRHTTEPQLLAQEPVIRHFLARPKPWDPSYATVNCMKWVREFAAMAQIVSPDLLKQLLSIQFLETPESIHDFQSA